MLLGDRVADDRTVGGGCVSDARRVVLASGRVVFAKSGAALPHGLLEAEAAGLRWLAEPAALRVPEVLACDGEVLVLEWVEPGRPVPNTDERLGRGLAQLHAAGAPAFGVDRSGYIGPLPVDNTPAPTWGEFYVERRLRPMAARAVAAGGAPPEIRTAVDRLAARIDTLGGPPEPPARLHGDLWSGNVLVDVAGEPWLVDPSAHGGHREVDLAMLALFGGLSERVVASYEEAAPLATGWRQRVELWQLLPLLVHAALFGGSYGARASAILRRLP